VSEKFKWTIEVDKTWVTDKFDVKEEWIEGIKEAFFGYGNEVSIIPFITSEPKLIGIALVLREQVDEVVSFLEKFD
jgi:hypothetical protein